MKILVLRGDKVVKKIDLTKNTFKGKGRFVFIIMETVVFYFDTTVGKMFGVEKKDLLLNKDLLGKGHRKVIQKHSK